MRMGYMRLLSISLPAVLIVTMVILILLYRRNVNYRNKMASQTQLVRLGEMARMLSHEIKNPLGAIRLQTGFLKRALPEDNHTPLLMIEEEIQRIISLTTKIGDFIKDPVGRYERIELAAFLEQMPRRFDYPVKFTVEPPGSGHTVFIMANPDRLKSSIENVIQNAIESMEGIKGKRVPIEIKLYEDKKKAVISIADKGCGISKENRKVIFRPFFTTKAKGSGLGLFISQRFIHAVGGKLILNSHKDMGTEVKVILNKV
jgi:two-component system sensor histidine kinase HydH